MYAEGAGYHLNPTNITVAKTASAQPAFSMKIPVYATVAA
jgi:hypothetical protein